MRLTVALAAAAVLASLLAPASAHAQQDPDDAVTFTVLPSDHEGDSFEATLTYNVDDHPTSYRDVPDEVTVVGGTLEHVRRHTRTGPDRNKVWVLTVDPTDTDDVTLTVRGVTATVPHTAGPGTAKSVVPKASHAGSLVFASDAVTVGEAGSESVGYTLTASSGWTCGTPTAAVTGDVDVTASVDDGDDEVAVSAAADDDAGDDTATVTLSSVCTHGTESDETLTDTLAVTVTDDDTEAFDLNYAFNSILVPLVGRGMGEGEEQLLLVRLATEPSGDVMVRVESSDGDVLKLATTSGGTGADSVVVTKTSANWNRYTNLWLQAQQDTEDTNDDETVTVTVSIDSSDISDYGADSESETITVYDDEGGPTATTDTPIVLEKTSVTVVEEGDAEIVRFAFTNPDPDQAVYSNCSIHPNVSRGGSSDVQSLFGFSRVFVAAGDDVDDTDDTATFTLFWNCEDADVGGRVNVGAVTLTITVTDDDKTTAGIALDQDSLTVDEGGADSVGFTVTAPGTGWVCAVTAARTGSSDVTAVVDTTDLQVDVSAAEDDSDYVDDTAVVTVTATCTMGTETPQIFTDTLAVTVTDNDTEPVTASFTFDEDSKLVVEGGSAAVDYTAVDPSGDGWSCGNSGSASPANSDLTVTEGTGSYSFAAAEDMGNEWEFVTYTVTRTCTKSGVDDVVNSDSVEVTIADNEHGLNFLDDILDMDEGTNRTVNLSLRRPTATSGNYNCATVNDPYTVTGDSDVTKTAHTFGNLTSSTVTIAAAADTDGRTDVAEVSVSVTCTHTDSVANPDVVLSDSLTVWVNDAQAIPGVGRTVSGRTVVFEDAGTDVETSVVLANRPDSAKVVVSLPTAADFDSAGCGGIAPTDTDTVTFTPTDWNTPQVLAVTDQAFTEHNTDYASPVCTMAFGVSALKADDTPDTAGNYANTPISERQHNYWYRNVNQAILFGRGQFASTPLGSDPLVLEENQQTRFNVWLASEPSANVTVTWTANETAEATVTHSIAGHTNVQFDGDCWQWSCAGQYLVAMGVSDDDSDDEVTTFTLTAVGGDYEGRTATVNATVTDDDTPLVVDPATVDLDEDGTGTFTVELFSKPASDVTVSAVSGDTDAATVTASRTFTPDNWNTARTFTVTGVDDTDKNDEEVMIVVSATSDTGYSPPDVEVTAKVTDDDKQDLVLDETTLDIGEGGTATFTVELTQQPTATVTVSVTSGDTGAVTVNKSSLEFTTSTWEDAQSVTVTGVHDLDNTNEQVTITLDASGGGFGDADDTVTVNVNDDDDPLEVSKTTLTVDEQGTDTFTVKLPAQPAASVVVNVATSDPGAALPDLFTLTFTRDNWNTARTVTVTGTDDADTRVEDVTITLSVTAGNYRPADATVAVNVTDNDTEGLVFPAFVEVDEGRGAPFTVKLATEPDGNAIINVTAGASTKVSLDKNQLTFTPSDWNTAQTVVVTGLDDDDADDEVVNVFVSVCTSCSGNTYPSIERVLTVRVDDDETERIVVASNVTVSEEDSALVGVRLGSKPSGDVTVTITGVSTATPSSLTFTPGNWNRAQQVTVTAPDDEDTDNEQWRMTLRASGSGYDAPAVHVDITVADNDGATGPLTITTAGGATIGTYELIRSIWGWAPEVRVTGTNSDLDITWCEVQVRFAYSSRWYDADTYFCHDTFALDEWVYYHQEGERICTPLDDPDGFLTHDCHYTGRYYWDSWAANHDTIAQVRIRVLTHTGTRWCSAAEKANTEAQNRRNHEARRPSFQLLNPGQPFPEYEPCRRADWSDWHVFNHPVL